MDGRCCDPRLITATRSGNADAVQELLEELRGPCFDVNDTDSFGRGLLWYAVGHGHTDTVRVLLEQGATVNGRDTLGWMPLHTACYHCYASLALFLLEQRADLNAKTHAGQTPRWLAQSCAKPGCAPLSQVHVEIAEALEALGGSLGLPPSDWENPRGPRPQRHVPPDDVRCCTEDGQRYTLHQLIQTYAHEKEMYTVEECEEYYAKEMPFPPDTHDAWQLPELKPLQPGEFKFG